VKNILGDHGWGGVKTNFFTPPNGWVNLGLLLLITVFRQKKWILQNLIFDYTKKQKLLVRYFSCENIKVKRKKIFPEKSLYPLSLTFLQLNDCTAPSGEWNTRGLIIFRVLHLNPGTHKLKPVPFSTFIAL
jgi:hypothetical protein